MPRDGQGKMDHTDMLWNKMQILKGKYLQVLRHLYNSLSTSSHQNMLPEQLAKVKRDLHRMILFLNAPKGAMPKEDNFEAFEKQVVSYLKRWKQQFPPLNIQDHSHTNVSPALKDRPMESLVKVIDNMSSQALASAVSDIERVLSVVDKLGSSAPGARSQAAMGQDLAQTTRFPTSLNGNEIPKNGKKRVNSVALYMMTSNGNVVNSLQSMDTAELETQSTALSRMKRLKIEAALHEEIDHVNERLIETRVEVDSQGAHEAAADGKDGIVVSCLYNATVTESNGNEHGNAFYIALPPLRFLIPPQYPDCSPIVLEDHSAVNTNYSLSYQAWDTFRRTVRCLPSPILLRDMVNAWDVSAHSAVLGAAICQGGGCFSSSYGSWTHV